MPDWQSVRVFISSTFRDMHAERNHLVKVVFPALRERLLKHRIDLIDVDLRWGVTQEQAEKAAVLGLCLQQIDKCRPFFLGILGHRYGCVPEHYPADAVQEFGWLKEQAGQSLTELEIMHGVLQNPRMRGRTFFYFRNEACLESIPQDIRRNAYEESSLDLKARLADLKDRIRNSGCPVENYHAEWDVARGCLVGLKAFGGHVREQLWQAIREVHQLADPEKDTTPPDPLQDEQEEHRRFMESRLRVYVGRESVNVQLLEFANGDDVRPCLLTGPSGSGKSAALAHFVRTFAQQHSDAVVVPHFIGASARSSSLRRLLTRLCLLLKEAFKLTDAVPDEMSRLAGAFRELLAKTPGTARVVLVVDALNQLDEADRAHDLWWLPQEFPPNVKLVLSCLEDATEPHAVLSALAQRPHRSLGIGPLTDDERRRIISDVPSLSAKTLDEIQVDLLLTNPATENPLFLLVTLEELRGFGSFEQLDRRIVAFPHPVEQAPRWPDWLIRSRQAAGAEPDEQRRQNQLRRLEDIESALHAVAPVADTLTALFLQVIDRLRRDFESQAVRTVLRGLATARQGLSDRELLDLVEGPAVATEANQSDLFSILRQLRPYLLSRAELNGFYHQNLLTAVQREYLETEVERREAHASLAEYFRRQADPSGDGEWTGESPRGLEELPYHLAGAGADEPLRALLTDVTYLHQRTALCDVHQLIQDYDLLPSVGKPTNEFRDFLNKHVQRLLNHRGQFFALLHHEGFPAGRRQAERLVAEGRWHKPWLRTRSAMTMTLNASPGTPERIEPITSFAFERSSATDLADQAGRAFHVMRLGQLGVIDVGAGRELEGAVDLRPTRPLLLSSAPHGRKLVVAYENGEADVLALTYSPSGNVVRQRTLATVSYLVPESEAPVLEWAGDALLYQTDPTTLIRMSFATEPPGTETHALPRAAAGELSAAALVGGRWVICLRQGNDLVAMVIGQEEKNALWRKPRTDAVAISACGPQRVAIAATDRLVRVFELTEKLTPVQEVSAGNLLCLAWDGSQLVWIIQPHLHTDQAIHAWAPGTEAPRQIDESESVFPKGLWIRIRRLLARPDRTLVGVSDREAFTFAIQQGGKGAVPRIQALFQGGQGRIFAIRSRPDGVWLLDNAVRHDLCVVPKGQFELRHEFGVDGAMNLLAACPIGRGVLVNLLSHAMQQSETIPPGVVSVAGDPDVGFWIADRLGMIGFATADGACRPATQVQVDSPGMAQVHCWGALLVWCGTCQYRSELGTDSAFALHFYRREKRRAETLTFLGKRIFTKADANLEALDFDATRNRLLVVFGGAARSQSCMKVGTVDDFIACREQEFPVADLGGYAVVRLKVTPDGAGVYLLTVGGALRRLDAETFAVQALLTPSVPFTDLARGPGSPLLVIENESQPYFCEYEVPSCPNHTRSR